MVKHKGVLGAHCVIIRIGYIESDGLLVLLSQDSSLEKIHVSVAPEQGWPLSKRQHRIIVLDRCRYLKASKWCSSTE